MPQDLDIVEARTPGEVLKRCAGKEILSFKELMDARSAVAFALAEEAGFDIEGAEPNFKTGVALAELLHSQELWQHRITTCTHIIHTPYGYRFTEWQPEVVSDGIVDGGVPYPEELWDKGRFLDETRYNAHPGGCYPIEDWLRHPVLAAVVGDVDTLNLYGKIVRLLSLGRVGSAGRESIWCPQSLPVGHGRAWALGAGGDGAYPPNHTTTWHWAAGTAIVSSSE